MSGLLQICVPKANHNSWQERLGGALAVPEHFATGVSTAGRVMSSNHKIMDGSSVWITPFSGLGFFIVVCRT
jgi:hypothetical protein